MPGRGLSRKSGGPEAGCGVLIRFHGLKVPRDYKFPSCKKQPGHLLISVIKMDNTHADQIREQFFFIVLNILILQHIILINSGSYSASTSLTRPRKVLLALMWESVPGTFF